MKREELSIRWKLFAYLTGFVLFIIMLLWLVQTVFLDDFYQRIKIRSVVKSAEYIESNFDSDDLELLIDGVSFQEEVSVNLLDGEGNLLIRSNRSHDSVVEKFLGAEIKKLYMEAVSVEGGVLKSYQFERSNPLQLDKGYASKTGLKSIVYANVIEIEDGGDVILLVDSLVTPIETTVETLRIQLLYVTIALVLSAALLAIVLSKKIASPLIEINRAARTLGDRNYSVRFEGSGYREVVELRDTLNTAVTELSKTEKLQRELIANISHDLKTPLTMIIGYSEVMRDIPAENTPENVQVVIDEANRLNRLVSDVLDISKLQSGIEILNKSRFNLTLLIDQTIDRCAKLIGQEGYKIEFIYDEHVWVEGDELKISQVVYNLLGNAVNHTGKDKTVKVEQTLAENSVRISFKDSGEGVSPEQLENIWERYYKQGKVHRRAAIGTGLGLSIVKSVIEMHGGECGVKSAKGMGSDFWFQLSKC